jgi:small-conductance mechanosensitive channel
MHNWTNWKPLLFSLGALGGAACLALVLHSVLFAIAKRVSARTASTIDNSLVRYGEKPARLILFLLDPFRHLLGLGSIAAIAWLLIALIDVFDDLISARHNLEQHDNLLARRIQTQVRVLRRVAAVIIVIVALAFMLMTFPSIQHVGESLFASAGLVAVVAGLAARTTLNNLFAGVQIALTQPIRLDDVVIVEGEWGRIEEITTTYVVVRIWDLRRLVVPVSYFIDKPFQNWTRQTADLLGTVFIYADYSAPVEEVRQELHRLLTTSAMWDGKVWGLQVTNASEHTLELRALMSAPDSSTVWDLRCYIREKLIQFLQTRYPQSLPKTRAEVGSLTRNSTSATADALLRAG